MAASACAHCRSKPRTGRLPVSGVELTLDTPDDGLALDLIADEKRIAQCGRRIVGDQYVRYGCAGRRGGGLGPGFEFHAGVDVVGRPGAQDQRPAPAARDRVEGPGSAAGPAGECAEVLDSHISWP